MTDLVSDPEPKPHAAAVKAALDGPTDDMAPAAGARAVVRGLLARCVGDTARVQGDAELAVTELVANAIVHADGLTAFSADVDHGAARLRLQVEDASREEPRMIVAAEPGMPGGRGWAIVKRLATTVTVALLPHGKRITATFAL
ncbi:ATP-binding protein [Streptomyces sp. MBT27]|uniref:ATP-binding protein n=1 Tax=Streptomyces sp. MBT27 TaxID=1488356 RepID=UPI001F083E49|nr:ATP-binding protein [Streptomyces sp. MBT27]